MTLLVTVMCWIVIVVCFSNEHLALYSIPLVCKTGKVILQIKNLSIYLCVYVTDPSNPEVTMLKEPISHLHSLAHCDVIDSPPKPIR